VSRSPGAGRPLEQALVQTRAPVHVTPATTDRTLAAEWLGRFEGAGLDGLVAKALDGVYEPDRRAWRKVKHTRTADCVVAGYRLHKRGTDLVGSLLLGLYTDEGQLAMAGVIGAFPMARRRELFAELQPLVTSFEGHPWDWGAWMREAAAEGRAWRGSNSSRWNPGKELSFVPLRPERVVEVRYDHLEDRRFRHTAQFLRWRPDRDPRSCTYDQLEETVNFDLADVLATKAT
jgi:ATP-dependent DNA ligase